MTKNKHQIRSSGTILLVLFSCISTLLTAQPDADGSYPQYLFPEFSNATILMKNGKSQSTKINYNMVTEKMVYEKDGNLYDLMNPETIDTIIILGRKFIPVSKRFNEFMLKVPHITLFTQHKGELMPAGTPAGYGGTSQLAATTRLSSIELAGGRYNLSLPADFIVNVTPVYWILKQNEMLSFINEKQFLKLFPGKESDLKTFIKKNKIKIDKPDHLRKLITYCNELLQ